MCSLDSTLGCFADKQPEGKIHPYIEAKIVDNETMEECPPNQPGELITRKNQVIKDYYSNKNKLDNTIINQDDWLWTGDLATSDEDDYINIIGRSKDMIIRGEEYIYLREIEELLYGHQAILNVQVVGVLDEKYGEEIVAWIILKEGVSITDTDIRDYCIGQISYHKIPKRFEFVNEYPMTANGKVQKYRLQEMSAELLE